MNKKIVFQNILKRVILVLFCHWCQFQARFLKNTMSSSILIKKVSSGSKIAPKWPISYVQNLPSLMELTHFWVLIFAWPWLDLCISWKLTGANKYSNAKLSLEKNIRKRVSCYFPALTNINLFMHNFVKWPHILKKSYGVNTARFLKYVWPFYNIMHERVKWKIQNEKLLKNLKS